MELVNTSPSDIGITDPGYAKSNATEMEVLLRRFDEETKKFDKVRLIMQINFNVSISSSLTLLSSFLFARLL